MAEIAKAEKFLHDSLLRASRVGIADGLVAIKHRPRPMAEMRHSDAFEIVGDPPDFTALEDTLYAGHRCLPPDPSLDSNWRCSGRSCQLGSNGPIRRIKYSIGVLLCRLIAKTVPRLARARPSSSQ